MTLDKEQKDFIVVTLCFALLILIIGGLCALAALLK